MVHSTKSIIINEGDKFGRWEILKELESYRDNSGVTYRQFKCKCKCGNIKNVKLKSLRSGESKSCGCLKIELVGNRARTNGMSSTKIYKVYDSMKQRCINKNNISYRNYGGRGIQCLWNTFEEFYKDMGDTYKEGLTIERNNNNGNYCKSNCSWETRITQANNTRLVHNITHNGETHSIAEWARILNKNVSTLRVRIHRGKSIFN